MHLSHFKASPFTVCIIGACALLLLLVLTACGGGTRGTTDTTIQVRGILRDSSGQAVAGAEVRAGAAMATTDSAGEFSSLVEQGVSNLEFKIQGNTIETEIPPIDAPVQLSFSVNQDNSEVILESEAPIAESTATPAPTNTTAPGENTPTPVPLPSATATTTPTPTPIPSEIQLSVNQGTFSINETAIFSISATGGSSSPVNGKSIVLVVGTLDGGETSITFSNNQTVVFPTSASDLYYTLSIQNFVQTMQNGSVVFNLPVGVVSDPVSLFAQALAVDSSSNALVASSSRITIQIVPESQLE